MIRALFGLIFQIIQFIWRLIWRVFWTMAGLLMTLVLVVFFMTGGLNRGSDGLADSLSIVGDRLADFINDSTLFSQGTQGQTTSQVVDTHEGHTDGTRWNQASATIYLDPTMDKTLYSAYEQAIENWNQTGVFRFDVVAQKEEAVIFATQVHDSQTSAAGEARSQINLVTNRFTDVTVHLNSYYLLNPIYSYDMDRIIHTAEHELGHAIGLEHNEGQSVMQSKGSLLGIQTVDIENVRQLYAS